MGKQSKRRKSKRPSPDLKTSLASKKIRHAKDLHKGQEQSIKLNDEMQGLLVALQDESKPQPSVIKEMELLCEAQTITLDNCQVSAGFLNPTPGLNQALKSIEHEESRKRAAEVGVQRSSRGESENIKLARAIVAGENKENTPPTSRTIKHRNAKGGNVNSANWRPPFRFPLPRNGTQYSPPEVVVLFNDQRLKERQHSGAAKRYLIRLKLVPVKDERSIRKVLSKAEGDPSNAPDWWNNVGQPPLVRASEFQAEFEASSFAAGSKTLGESDVVAFLKLKKGERLRALGIEPVDVTVSPPTQRKYDAMGQQNPNAVVAPAAVDKTETRLTAGKSLIASALLAGIVLVMVYQPCELEDAEEWKFPEEATDGAREGYEIMKEVHGGKSIVALMPCNQINCDDMQQLVSNGNNKRDKPSSRTIHIAHYQGNRLLAPCKGPATVSIGGSAVQSQPQNDPVNPQRVKISTMSNASGDVGEPTLNYLGLSEDELPTSKCPTGFATIEVQGLLKGQSVYLNFMRKGAVRGEEARYVAFRNGPLHRFVDEIRARNHGVTSDAGLQVKHTVVVSSDGDLGQDKAVIEKERSKKIRTWKHNPARTHCEQSQDLQNVFPTMNCLEKEAEVNTNVPDEMVPNLVFAKSIFEKANIQFGLKLGDKKKKTLMHHLARFPDQWVAATLKKNVLPGYLANGQIDRVSRMMPDLKVMVQETLDRPMMEWEWVLVRKHMARICLLLLKHGSIPDKTFIEWGFPADLNSLGEEIYRLATIAQEYMQRAKIMDHEFQTEQRDELDRQNLAKINAKLANERNLVAAHLATNLVAEEKLLKHLDPNGDGDRSLLVNVTVALMNVLKRDELKAFALVRLLEALVCSHGLPKNKGGLVESMQEGANTLLCAAFDLRAKPVILKEISLVEAVSNTRPGRVIPEMHSMYSRGDYSYLRFTVTVDFVELVKKSFDPFGVTVLSREDATVDLEHVQDASNLLHDILQERLTTHVTRSCKESLRDHWVWHFTRANMGRVAAIMVLMQHVKSDLEPAKWNGSVCLLQDPRNNTFLLVENQIKVLEGCYLMYDTVLLRFIRSGKAVNPGRTMWVRCFGPSGHLECAKVPDLRRMDSNFYRSYPSKEAPTLTGGTRRGYFEQLQLYCALGFDRSNTESLKPLVETHEAAKSIFLWEPDTIERLEKLNMAGATTLQDRQLSTVGYLVETAFELALAPGDNVSQSQGYEAMFGGSARN